MNKITCSTLETLTESGTYSKANSAQTALYKIKLSQYQEIVPSLETFLSSEELKRANKYHFAKDKNRFVLCRTLLKFILAEHTELDIKRIVISNSVNKKPYLAADQSIYFNVSHSGDYGIIAIANREIGVDLEFINPTFNFKEIMPHVFNKPEKHEVIHSNDQRKTFYQLWTRKEAIVKATGKGINDQFLKVPSLNGVHTTTNDLLGDFNNMQVFSFEIEKNHIAAVALSNINETSGKISFYDLPLAFNTFMKLTQNKNRE